MQLSKPIPLQEDAVNSFIAQHQSKITGVLSGFDRLVIRGTLRRIAYTAGMFLFLCFRRVLLKNFGQFADDSTARLKQALEKHGECLGRPVIYLPSSQTDKEAHARKILEKDGAVDGVIAIFKTLEMGQSFDLYRNAKTKMLPDFCKGKYRTVATGWGYARS